MDGIIKFLVGAGVCVAIVAGGFAIVPDLIDSAADDLKNQAINAAIDASGVKDQIAGLLDENVAGLAAARRSAKASRSPCLKAHRDTSTCCNTRNSCSRPTPLKREEGPRCSPSS